MKLKSYLSHWQSKGLHEYEYGLLSEQLDAFNPEIVLFKVLTILCK